MEGFHRYRKFPSTTHHISSQKAMSLASARKGQTSSDAAVRGRFSETAERGAVQALQTSKWEGLSLMTSSFLGSVAAMSE